MGDECAIAIAAVLKHTKLSYLGCAAGRSLDTITHTHMCEALT